MLIPADAPGTPMRSSNVGASVRSSKPTAALSTPAVFAAYTFSAVWCVETMLTQPARRKKSAIETASAAPSSGSVAEPSSSSSTSESRVA